MQPDTEPAAPSLAPSQNSLPGSPDQNVLPENIPVPETEEEDELFANVFHMQEDQCWELEFPLGYSEINQLSNAVEPQEAIAYLVTNAKKQKVEVRMSNLSKEDRLKFEAAKQKEISSWLDTATVSKIARNRIPPECILRCRWILTWEDGATNSHLSSTSAQGNSQRVPKARLVVLGYEDPELHNVQRDSPTLTKLGRSLLLQYAANMNWEIASFDIKTAFLRGTANKDRVLGLEPVPEFQERLLQLLKGAYVRADAPLLWFQELKRALQELNFVQSPMDPCIFMLPGQNGQNHGMIGVHVDDGLYAGSNHLMEKLAELSKKFPFGSQKARDFVFTGLHISQKENGEIHVDQSQYVKEIEPIRLSQERKKQLTENITENERQSLRAVIGSFLYAAVNTRPDLCSRLGKLQSRINNGTVCDLLEANRTLHEAKQFADVKLKYQPIQREKPRFIAFSDASFASEKSLNSHQGMLIMACDEKVAENERSKVNPILWASRKIQTVAVSTLSAEAMSLAGSVDALAWVRLFWAWMMYHRCEWKLGEETLSKLPPAFSALKDDILESPNATLCKTHQSWRRSQPNKLL